MHKALVFLSCGQRNDEKALARQIESMIRTEFQMDCYNADSVQGFDDVMSITERLSVADYFLFVDFKRPGPLPISVFSHQEFALARAWGISEMLAFIEDGLEPTGMMNAVLAHPIRFQRDNLVELVGDQIRRKGWSPSYSRNLVATTLRSTEIVQYTDHGGTTAERIWHLDIENRRTDRAAVDAVAILAFVGDKGTEPERSPDRSYLKWAGQKEGYRQTILPKDLATFDAFAVRAGADGLFLHSASDRFPRQPIVTRPSSYVFVYHIYSASFPLLRAEIEVSYTGPIQLQQSVIDTATTASLRFPPGMERPHADTE